MDEEQLQRLWDLHAKNAGFKDIGEFKTLMENPNARKVYFDNSNKQLGFKDYNDFDLTLKKKVNTVPTSSQSSSDLGQPSGKSGIQLNDEQRQVLAKAVIPKTPQQEQFDESQRRSAKAFALGEKPEDRSFADDPGPYLANFASNFNQAVVSGATSIPKSIAIVASKLDKVFGIQDKPTEDYGTYKVGDLIDKKALEWGMTATDPSKDNFITRDVASGLGSIMAIIMSGGESALAKEGAGLTAAQLSQKKAILEGVKDTGKLLAKPQAIVGSTSMATPEFAAAKKAGLSDDEAFKVFAKNYFVGATEILPIENALSRINKLGGGKLAEIAKAGFKGGVEEGTQETVQQILSNKIAQGSYDPKRDLFQDVVRSGGAGFFIGFILPGIGAAMHHMTPEQKVETQKELNKSFVDTSVEQNAKENKDQSESSINSKENIASLPEQGSGETVSTQAPTEQIADTKGNPAADTPIQEATKIAEESGFDHPKQLLNSVAKRTGETFENVQDVPKEVLDKVVKERSAINDFAKRILSGEVIKSKSDLQFHKDHEESINKRLNELSEPKNKKLNSKLSNSELLKTDYSDQLNDEEKKFLEDRKSHASSNEVIPTRLIFKNNGDNTVKFDRSAFVGDNHTTEEVNINSIIPTDLLMKKNQLRENADTKNLPVLYKKWDKYYVVDGHHRIAEQILSGATDIKAKVYTSQESQSASGIESVPPKTLQEDGKITQGRQEGRQENVLGPIPETLPNGDVSLNPIESSSSGDIIPPTETTGEPQLTSGGSKKLSVIFRTNEDVSNLIKEVFDGTYDPQSNVESGAKTKEFINKVGGIDNAFASRNLLSGAPKMILYAEYIDSLQNRLNENPGNVTLLRNAMIEFAVLAKQRGQEIQILDYIYENYGALFTYEKQLEKFAANTQDGEVPREIQEQLKDITERYQELLKEVDRLEKIRQENEDNVSIFNIKESLKREGNYRKQRGQQTIEQAQAKREQLKKDFAKTLKGGALQASVIPGLTTEQLKIVVNIAKTYLDELAGNVDLAIANTKAFLKESGKDLTDEQLQVLRKEIEPVWNFDGLKIPYNLIRNLVAQGFDTIEKLAPKVQEMMQVQHPSISERRVRDIISGYGRTINPSKEGIEGTIRRIKVAGQLKSKLDDLIKGERPKKSGLLRNSMPKSKEDQAKEKAFRAEVRAKTRYINQLLKDLPIDEVTQETELRTALDAALATLKNRQEDLNFALSKGEAIKNNNKKLSDPEIEEQKQITQDIKEIYDSVFKDESAADNTDRVTKALNASIDKMKNRIDNVNGELFKAKKDKVSNADIKDLQDRLKRLRDFRNFLLQDSGILEVKRLESLISSAQKTEDRLKESIRTGDFSKRSVKDNYIGYNVADDEAELARQQELLKIADTPEQRKAIQLNIDVLTKKIQSVKDLLKKRAELRGVKDEAVKIQYAQELANRSAEHKKTLMAIEMAFSLTRAMKAGFDMSIAWIQLMLPNMHFATKDAVSYAKHLVQGDRKNFKSQSKEHFKQGIKALVSESTHKTKTLELSQHPDYELAKDVGLKVSVGDPKLEAQEEALMYASFSKISGLPNKGVGMLLKKAGAKKVGEFVKNSNIPQSFERAAHAMANVVRLQRFSEMADKLRKEGKTPFANREEFKKIAKYVNDSSGAASVGPLEPLATKLPYVFFSARLISQALKYASPYAMIHYYKLGNNGQSLAQRINPFTSSLAQRAFMEDYVYSIGTQYLIMQSVVSAVNAAMGYDDEDKWSIETDPRSSSFMQIRIPGKDGRVTYVEPWGPYRTMIVFMSRMMTGNMKRRNGELLKMGEGFAPTRKSLGVDFLFNKLAPTPSFVAKAFDVHYKYNEEEGTYSETNSYGNEYEFDKEVTALALPMYFSTISEGFKYQNPALAAGLTAMAFFGLGVNTYDESPKEEE